MWVMMMLVMLMVGEAKVKMVYVGGKHRLWHEDVNYTMWASQQTFYVGDWLGFWYDRNYHDVLEVNKTSYETCNSANFITNITRSGRDIFELEEARTYYFICSKGYCWGGMKLAIDVHNSPSPAPSPHPNHATATRSLNMMHILVLAISLFFVSCCF